MYYCNDLINLSVLSLYEGELLGVVDKLYFDKKLKKLIELELVGEEGNKFTLPSKNIYHIGKNAITVKNNQSVNLKVEDENLFSCPINSKAYTIRGEYLGVIKEVSLTDKFLTEKFSLDNDQSLSVDSLASSGKNTTIFYEESDNVNVKKFTPQKSPKIFKSQKEVDAKILPIDIPPTPSTNLEEINLPKPNFQSADFLLGRICTKDIFNFNNEILIKAHAVITKKILKEVNKFGKLRELMLYSK